jgi:hypothetical protein
LNSARHIQLEVRDCLVTATALPITIQQYNTFSKTADMDSPSAAAGQDELINKDVVLELDQGQILLVSSAKKKTLTLSTGAFSITDKSDAETDIIPLSDCIGATFSFETSMLTVVLCCPVSSKDGKSMTRKLKRMKVPFDSEQGVGGKQCAEAINCVLDGQEAGSEGWQHIRRKLLVLINPFGGSGKAKQTYFKQCDEILSVRFDVGG